MFRLISRAVSLEATPLFDRFCLLVTWVPEASVVRGPSAMAIIHCPVRAQCGNAWAKSSVQRCAQIWSGLRWDNTTREAQQRER